MADNNKDEGQVSEVGGLAADPGDQVYDGDAVSGQPEGESGRVDDGPTGPDAPTNAPQQDRHPDQDDVETTG